MLRTGILPPPPPFIASHPIIINTTRTHIYTQPYTSILLVFSLVFFIIIVCYYFFSLVCFLLFFLFSFSFFLFHSK